MCFERGDRERERGSMSAQEMQLSCVVQPSQVNLADSSRGLVVPELFPGLDAEPRRVDSDCCENLWPKGFRAFGLGLGSRVWGV